ncbi:methyl-accepting chemotaxis protein [Alginatibacterium sediminis]|uniref:Methyl-accepting chemotaxis protein n=1 Tax=Alginatibacterium sediminis TaxID=2164068 RepID=A0A420EFX3_9ALTE|nr:methyl-accepting chemotaxis protein [Alginatibacterium sediminis]RKF19611.1 methyl-accepting chemotaxis protein [Alginatibacterium sediminis]
MGKLSLKYKVISFTLVMLILFSGLQTWIQSSAVKNQTLLTLEQNSSSAAKSTSSLLGAWLANKFAGVKGLSVLSDEPAMRATLQQTAKTNAFDLVYFGSEQGKMLLSDASIELPGDYDPRGRPWYTGAIANGQYVSDPYEDASSGEQVISVAAKVNGGVIGGDLSLSDVIAAIEDLSTENSYAMIVDSDLNVLVHPDRQYVLKIFSELDPSVKSFNPSVDGKELFSAKLDGKDVLLKSSQIELTDWSLVQVYDEDLVLKSVDTLVVRSFMLAIVMLAVFGISLLIVIGVLIKPLEALHRAMKELNSGTGDLTARVPIVSKDEIGQLAEEINLFFGNIHSLVSNVVEDSVQISSAATVSRVSSEEAQSQIRRQQEEVTQVAAAINEMGATAAEVASNAELTANSARESTESCEAGKQVILRNQQQIDSLAGQLDSAVSTVTELEQNTQDINEILSTIQGIAEQTNLLALNAAIEAARAGDQGRGFAVVADEVRNLSQRTHSSTEEIRSMIERLQSNTKITVKSMEDSQKLASESVEEANRATQTLEEITSSIAQISDMAIQISSAAEEQRAVTEEIGRNTQGIQDATDHLTEQSESNLGQVKRLDEISERLSEQVSNFKI